MSNQICRRCRKNNMNNCSLGYKKTEEQIIREQYSCFQERIYNIDMGLHHTDDEFEPYKNEINYKSALLHANMRKSERNLRKICQTT